MNAEKIDFQLDMFESPRERILRAQLERVELLAQKTKDSADKVRKALFARNNELQRLVTDLSDRLNIIERFICEGTI